VGATKTKSAGSSLTATTTAEILKRKQLAREQEQADRLFYAQTVQRLAVGQCSDDDRIAVESIAEDFGFDLASDLDKLRKLNDWAGAGFVEVDSPDYQERLSDLQRSLAEAQVDRDELRTKLQDAEIGYQQAFNAHSKFTSRGGEIKRFHASLPHVFAVGGADR
jgi:hypothetical protein